MSIDQGWTAQAVTALDLSAMAASENILNASRDVQTGQLASHGVEADANARSQVLELASGKIFDSDNGPVETPLHVSVKPDMETGTLRPLAETLIGSPQEQASQFWSSVLLNRDYSADLANPTAREQDYIGHIVNYTA
ncbi:MAG: hypothetical protein AUJ49_09400 [Desulfovibrionaceae bacterium CG1_02_65_16]|nr:MAG: hypothetical protein AUJ49_09400 [Desulfovibrionaceae bacterium CG1_02_65_16]